jgi:hypothetical protein
MKNYGMTVVGKHTVVCVRLNASSIDAKYLEAKFPDLLYDYYEYRGKGIVRIEGCVLNREDFHTHYEYAKARAQMDDVSAKMMLLERDIWLRENNLMRGTINGEEGYFGIEGLDDVL